MQSSTCRHFGFNPPRAKGIDLDVVKCPLDGHGVGELNNSALRGAADGVTDPAIPSAEPEPLSAAVASALQPHSIQTHIGAHRTRPIGPR